MARSRKNERPYGSRGVPLYRFARELDWTRAVGARVRDSRALMALQVCVGFCSCSALQPSPHKPNTFVERRGGIALPVAVASNPTLPLWNLRPGCRGPVRLLGCSYFRSCSTSARLYAQLVPHTSELRKALIDRDSHERRQYSTEFLKLNRRKIVPVYVPSWRELQIL